MTTGTIHTLDSAKGTGTLRCLAGTLVPFSTSEVGLRAGDAVTFRLTGGITGLYADRVEPAAVRPARRRSRPTILSRDVFLRAPRGLSPLAG